MIKIKVIVGFMILLLSVIASLRYSGNPLYYGFFSTAMNALLWAGFRQNRIFFDTFLGLFFWLGFWFKFSIRLAFLDAHFVDPTGSFDFTPTAMDEVMLVSSVGAVGLLLATFFRQRFLFASFGAKTARIFSNIVEIYHAKRRLILAGFVMVVILVAYLNITLGIYQRGMVPGVHLPFALNGIFSWLLLFGLTSVAAVIMNLEILRKQNGIFVITIALFENMCSSVSMLSRAMILNSSALLFALAAYDQAKVYVFSFSQKIKILILFVIIFASSVLAVNYKRIHYFYKPPEEKVETVQTLTVNTGSLFIDRWVGIEGVMSVVGFPKKGFDLFSQAWSETYAETGTTFYDIEIAKSGWSKINITQNHFISLPGILAFFYYPGSLLFLFICMFLLGIVGAGIEYFVYKFGGGNLFLCSLMAQVVAYRFAHFGYVPRQSYLLFGTLIVNVLLFYFLDKILGFRKNREWRVHRP